MRLVVALGGNALLQRGERPDAEVQRRRTATVAAALAPLTAAHELLVCHGNGPQIGVLAAESGSDAALTRPFPLDVLGAQTQGMIGYWLAQSLLNAGVTRPVVSVLTQTVVDPADPAFAAPHKPIGSSYDREQAHALAERYGWTVAPDGAGWRRTVPSPEPRRVVEQASVEGLLAAGSVVICAGGGGAPVVADEQGRLRGSEAVVDKDLTAALLAVALDADRLLVLTDVRAVLRGFGTPSEVALARLHPDEIPALALPPGSMAPKVEACRRFVEATGRPAAVGDLSDVAGLLAGTSGTTVEPRRRPGQRPPGALGAGGKVRSEPRP